MAPRVVAPVSFAGAKRWFARGKRSYAATKRWFAPAKRKKDACCSKYL